MVQALPAGRSPPPHVSFFLHWKRSDYRQTFYLRSLLIFSKVYWRCSNTGYNTYRAPTSRWSKASLVLLVLQISWLAFNKKKDADPSKFSKDDWQEGKSSWQACQTCVISALCYYGLWKWRLGAPFGSVPGKHTSFPAVKLGKSISEITKNKRVIWPLLVYFLSELSFLWIAASAYLLYCPLD